jgi:hypothetical protein
MLVLESNTHYHMKKVLLTTCAAALFVIAGMAQQQQKTKTGSDKYRSTKKTEQAIDQPQDSALNKAEQGVKETGRDIKEGTRRAGDEIERAAEETGEELKEGGEKVKESAETAGDSIEEGASQARDEVRETGQQMKEGAERTMEKVDNATSDQPSMDSSDASRAAQMDVEAVDGKEGPAGEVVYKFGDDYFYIDQAKEKKLVKIEESSLKESRHHVKVSTNPVTSDSKTKGKKSNKG